MESVPNSEFVNFVIIFLGSPSYIKNAHLRARLVDVSAAIAASVYRKRLLQLDHWGTASFFSTFHRCALI